ncbi:gfo/Idh/MocA family oxidoreductase [Halobacillus halophilus]|uniref:Oxidoreductase domain protein n=1 Tax=Halobacillus halophilus (strain ATCC 35676 / DSM 2266 / JCM 20832 / KCTC 3685 / LMG 17431 / NBRC 102448 / NCIMB 2269) TaxID=866895 RepID=I0JIY6_HALH3|nr:Gfo/Idh/MocA family oxidoreductase [Halobacillus halophilus]ASF38272.1 gfo/Idh/MocA family oxidoreductase [Halobacillus halophilus]CCG44104.1 oxidoreductase domain protein [Halobacillus halophilus DSM 2266]
MLRVALLSKWHVHAIDYAAQAQDNPNITISAVWDEDPARGKEWAEKLEVPFVQDLKILLSDPDIDAVIIASPTNQHKNLILAAAKHGKHIFTEKVLAFSVADCEQIFSAVDAAGVELMVSLPRLADDYFIYAEQAVNQGLLGQLTMVRCRAAHNGAVPSDAAPSGWLPDTFFNPTQCGGGAMIDLGAHPIYLANRLLGTPSAVTGHLQQLTERGVDDQSVAVVEYTNQAMAVLETSFISSKSPFQLELYGTEGTLMIENKEIRIKSTKLDTEEWTKPAKVPGYPLPINQWAAAIEERTTPSITRTDAWNLTLINQGAALSQKRKRRVDLQELTPSK